MINLVKEKDLFILTADHGCDPTWKGTDHTRENIHILIYTDLKITTLYTDMLYLCL